MDITGRRYCTLCGNAEEITPGQPCPDCTVVVTTELAEAKRLYDRLSEAWGRCCGGLSSDKSHLYLHPKQFGEVSRGEGFFEIGVECGLKLYADRAEGYWLFDNDSTCMDMPLDGVVAYPSGPTGWEVFLEQAGNLLESAADQADGAGFGQCPDGHHYYTDNGPCCGEESPCPVPGCDEIADEVQGCENDLDDDHAKFRHELDVAAYHRDNNFEGDAQRCDICGERMVSGT